MTFAPIALGGVERGFLSSDTEGGRPILVTCGLGSRFTVTFDTGGSERSIFVDGGSEDSVGTTNSDSSLP